MKESTKYKLLSFGIFCSLLLIFINSKIDNPYTDRKNAAYVLILLFVGMLIFSPKMILEIFKEFGNIGKEMRNDLNEYSAKHRNYNHYQEPIYGRTTSNNPHNIMSESERISSLTGVHQNLDSKRVQSITGVGLSSNKNKMNNSFSNSNFDRNRVNEITGMSPSNLRSDETYKFNKRRRPNQQKDPYGTMQKDGKAWVKNKL